MGRMAPVRPNNRNNVGPSAVRGAKIQKQRKKHKVVLESAGNKDDDKLRVVLSFHAEPPPGYTFIPAGNTQLTAAMKAFAKKGGHQIMAVSATPHAQRHELSREVHRIGYHVPTEVVAQVCSHYGIRLDSSGRIIGEQDSEKLFMKISQKGKVVLNENIRDQVTINTEAKEIIRDLFPRIPDNDLYQIIKTAFQLGDRKVGTAEEIPLVRRAQLSVVAHIRHSYTNYDRLLRQLPYNDARHAVEKATLQKLVEWRGDENDKTEDSRKAVDDAVREIVVLSDEESSESEIEEGQVLENEDVKTEPVRKPTRPEVTTEHRPVPPDDPSSAEDAPQGFRYLPQTSRRTIVAHQQPDAIHRQQQSRYALWDQVRHEYQAGMYNQEPARVLARIPIDESTSYRREPVIREAIHDSTAPVRYVVEDPAQVQLIREPSPPTVFRGADGRLYERLAHRTDETSTPTRRIYTPLTAKPSRLQIHNRRSASPRAQRPQFHHRTPSLNDDGTIVESIEPPDSAHRSPAINSRLHGTYHGQRVVNRMAVERNNPVIDLTSTAEQADERMHPFHNLPEPHHERQYQADHNMAAKIRQQPPRNPQLIDLGPQVPVTASPTRSGQNQYHVLSGQRYVPIPREQFYNDPATSRTPYTQPSRAQEYDRAPVYSQVPTRGHAVYETLDDRSPYRNSTRYATGPVHDARVAQQYYITGEQLRDYPSGHATTQYTAQAGRQLVVLDNGEPMDDVQHSLDSRPPTYRTTYVQY
ncbi:hypothetical protein LTS08_005295 [Lithohypha guttulata]|uniref:DUF2293 domain-containing protein n=1 Tax=Lithohypha guttulata TaxID=1690604 RepID=A0AAN7T807_9EURO|nr:hypothetical protein LTR05_001719 [Lithohypha guttulata]KAK5100544.1 hypothetical protein LTS08_005295 [Lithohypha guttulata]